MEKDSVQQPAGAHDDGQSWIFSSQPAHSLASTDVLSELQTNVDTGLREDDVADRLSRFGRNELQQNKGVQPWVILLNQFFNAMTLVLVMAVAASFGTQAWVEGGILAVIILLNIFIGFFQSLQAEKTIDALRSLGTPNCDVFRDSETMTILTAEVVPGDVINLKAGDTVPADMRLIDAVGLEADEALLTGESAPVMKDPRLVLEQDTGPGDRLNVVYSSTSITKGRGRGVVFATGMRTEIGLIAQALQQDKKPEASSGASTRVQMFFGKIKEEIGKFLGLTVGTPLQKKLSQLFLGLFCFAIVCAIIVLGANQFNSGKDVVIYAVTTAVGTIPVSLLLVLTVTMAAGTKKMLERHVIVRNLQSLEALGGITNICSDKTGTITQGRMIASRAWLPGVGTYVVQADKDLFNPTTGSVSRSFLSPTELEAMSNDETSFDIISPAMEANLSSMLETYLNIASLANLATLQQTNTENGGASQWTATGAPTEIAIEVFATRFGWNRQQLIQGANAKWKFVNEFPFDSSVKRMTVVYEEVISGKTNIFSKGAVERILTSCSTICINDKIEDLTSSIRDDIMANVEVFARQGLRVLAFAHGVSQETNLSAINMDHNKINRESFERDLVFLGLMGIYDPPRPESLASVQKCQEAGIVVHMLTGDHPGTAAAIAREVGILPSSQKLGMLPKDVADHLTMSAQEFDALKDFEIDALAQLPLVVARCAPSTKVRMIEALHRRQRYVAMTGDGVNDSPSLKSADIGIAMGSGSDVAKTSSDIVLTDDNFASILNAIEEGRRIFDNIQKFVLHVLAANVGFVLALLTGLAFKDRTGISVFLLTPVEIIWMLMGTGAFCETGLGFEKAVPDILKRPPMKLKYGIFTPEFYCDMIVYGLLQAACIIGCFTVVIWGFNDGDLGIDCNSNYSDACDPVFRARATSYTSMTWIFLFFAWELIDTRRSFFYMPNGVKAWAQHLWGNKFLFFSVTLVFAVVFPTLYIPVINRDVFLHNGISWEWAVVFITLLIFVACCESWKWLKRRYYGRQTRRTRIENATAV